MAVRTLSASVWQPARARARVVHVALASLAFCLFPPLLSVCLFSRFFLSLPLCLFSPSRVCSLFSVLGSRFSVVCPFSLALDVSLSLMDGSFAGACRRWFPPFQVSQAQEGTARHSDALGRRHAEEVTAEEDAPLLPTHDQAGLA